MHELIAASTLRITCGQSSGSGFIYRNEKIAITNSHVIEPYHSQGNPIEASLETGQPISAKVLSSSPPDQSDFAILELRTRFAAQPLKPQPNLKFERGREIIFSGFPHGISDLLVQEAIISGPASSKGFYIDGSVNGGNSGGPIADKATGLVLGIVTQRRFLGSKKLEKLQQEMATLVNYCHKIAKQGKMELMGIDFGALTSAIAQGFLLTGELFSANANAGIGIGFSIDPVDKECIKLGI
jgi:S1-C subfamily serine protease